MNLTFKNLFKVLKKKFVFIEATLYGFSLKSVKLVGKCSDIDCILLEQRYQLLNELYDKVQFDKSAYTEDLYILKNITVQIAGKQNGNNRVYPLEVLKKAVEKAQPFVKSRQMIGELDHISAEINPENPYPLVSRASHLILNLWMENDKVKADILILPTIYGKQLLNILKAGGKVGISLRGLGEVDSYGNVSDLDILTYDFVSFPSYSELIVDKSMLQKIHYDEI